MNAQDAYRSLLEGDLETLESALDTLTTSLQADVVPRLSTAVAGRLAIALWDSQALIRQEIASVKSALEGEDISRT